VAKKSARFLLALNSPLYAPIVLAVAIGKSSNGASSRYAGRFAINFASKQADAISGGSTLSERDSLLASVLDRQSASTCLTVGVCDPTRVFHYNPLVQNYHQPVIVGALVDKMCFWLFDGEQTPRDGKWHEYFSKVLVHPQNFTGYTVAAYDLLKARKINPVNEHKKAKKVLSSKLQEIVDPDQEHVIYDRLKTDSRRKRLRFAYISANPLHATSGLHRNGHSLILSFGTDKSSSAFTAEQRDVFSRAIMTGLIVPETTLENGSSETMQGILVAEISEAVKAITADPERSAYRICSHIKTDSGWEYRGDTAVRYLGVASARDLADCLKFLVEQDAFNSNPCLGVGSRHVDNTIDIRWHVSPVLRAQYPDLDRDMLRAPFARLITDSLAQDGEQVPLIM
jgi:hypothetical protein